MCGPECFAPSIVSSTVHVNSSDPTSPIRVTFLFNQSIVINSRTLLIASASSATQTLQWFNATVASFHQSYALNASQLGCSLLSMNSISSAQFLDANAVLVVPFADTRSLPTIYNCSASSTLLLTMNVRTATVVNQSMLILDIPSPVYTFNTSYSVQLAPGAFLSCMQPRYSSTSASASFVTPRDPLCDIVPLNWSLSAIDLSFPSASRVISTSSMTAQSNSNSARLYFSGVLPSSVPWLAFMAPLPMRQLQALVPNSTTVGAFLWNDVPSTRFSDRFVLHPDAVNRALPVRRLPSCMSFSDISLQCSFPADATGSLWQVYADWTIVFPDGSIGLRRRLPALPALSITGRPLSVSFPLSTLSPATVRRFEKNQQGIRQVPAAFKYTGDENVSPFDVSNTECNALSCAIRPVDQSTEPLFLLGSWGSVNVSTLAVYVGGPAAFITLACTIQQVSASWLICGTSVLPSGSRAVNLPFVLWDQTSLVLTQSADTYSYPYVPVVMYISG
jgi:hypothetical protein